MLKRITLTGADDSVRPKTLAAISQNYPFVEWGILVSKTRFGTPRFPSRHWLNELYDYSAGMNLSCHLCGELVKEYLLGDPRAAFQVGLVWDRFQRVQLNTHGLPHEFDEIKMLLAFSKINKEFIFQFDEVNVDLFSAIIMNEEWANRGIDRGFLFDCSHGMGVLPKDWPKAFGSVPCGYAGGLGPDNLKEQLVKIEEASGGADYWVDMETKLRTADDRVFSLSDCVKCLDIVKDHLENHKSLNHA